jgi:hypothetical protein
MKDITLVNYLNDKLASGVNSWAKDVLERKSFGLANIEERLLANLAGLLSCRRREKV